MKAIDPELTVAEIMRRWPCTIRVFLEFRLGCVGCPIACFHTLVDACEEHRVDPGSVLMAMDAALARSSESVPA
jgi:hybrid cluster-associated redox disulfide protein